MSPPRRRWLRYGLLGGAGGLLLPTLAAAQGADDDTPRRGRVLRFPRDHGAHPGSQIEWWYLTGSLAPAGGGPVSHGFQVTFFRSRTGLAEALPGRFAPRQLLFAHAALTELASGAHHHAQRTARWDGRSQAPAAHAALVDSDVAIGPWTLRRAADGVYTTRVESDAGDASFALALSLSPTQPLLLQGDRGFSRKGPNELQASHYYSQPQLAVGGTLRDRRGARELRGTAWLDHEWSDSLLPPEAEGWDWIGMNLLDGSALTAFRLRRARAAAASSAGRDAVWSGGSFRAAGGAPRSFGDGEVRFEPGRTWVSKATGARYPVEWRVATPIGVFTVRSLLDGQELDGAASTGAVYWEGLSELLDTAGRRVGLGYLEMTGYASRLRLGGD